MATFHFVLSLPIPKTESLFMRTVISRKIMRASVLFLQLATYSEEQLSS